MGSIGWWEILLIAVLVVLLFGARRLPEIGKGLGDGIRSFRDSLRGTDKESGGSDRSGPPSSPGR